MSEPSLPIEVHPDAAAVAARAAEAISDYARAALDARGSFTLALSGGRTPWLMLAELGGHDIDWSRAAIFQVDERVAPAGADSRNLTHILASLPESPRARVHSMPVEEADLQAATGAYAAGLPERFDLVHLGLGPDGHTASLVPGDPALDVRDRAVTLSGPYQGTLRMTLTYPVIDRARARLWVITGQDKRDVLARLRRHDPSIPAGRVNPDDSLVLADAAAAGA